ncbi:hypothetical protein B0A52_00716 [Exophiala mesophila]|uniref:Uncharacterized protein n=1 Tax=Exophiala mesophila TaxID=212818 RepID=A0A438NI11_EXOME|nr:hypothetical protein B0A52_00716 [Exophiala mesophila]
MAKSKVQARPSQLSNERIMDSSDEENDMVQGHGTAKKTKRSKPSANSPKTNGVGLKTNKSKRKSPTPESTTSDAVSSSSPLVEDEAQESSGAESDDGSDSEGDSSSATSSTSSANKRKSRPEPQTASRKKTKPNTSSKVRIAPVPYKAPSGYESFALSASDYASQSTSLFENLSGKQIWHISAPASLSLQSITELDIQAALQGRSILTKNGIDYNMHPTPLQHEILLLPAGQDSTYEQTEVGVTRTFDLREMSMIPRAKAKDKAQSSTASIVFTATKEGTTGQPRKQPEGLRQRYIPFGAQVGNLDQAIGKSRTTFQMPDEIMSEGPANKATTSSPKKMKTDGGDTPKKQKKDKSQASPEKKKKRRRIVDEEMV